MRSIGTSEPTTTATAAATTESLERIAEGVHDMIAGFRCAGTGRLVKAGVSMTHMHVMWLLQHHGDLSMSRLAELLDVSFSNATGIVATGTNLSSATAKITNGDHPATDGRSKP